ncbi:MAG: hypothetical protein WC608_03055 [Parcubacteria group bacterium]
MDSSINLTGKDLSLEEYVLGITPKVLAYKLDMAGVFEEVIGRLKSQFKYLPCFRPLVELLNVGNLPGCATRRTDIALVKFPEGKSERAKAVEIQVLEEGDVETVSTRKSVLLTEDGEILIWSAVYDRPVGDTKLCRWTGGRDEVAKESRFEIFDKEKLQNALSQAHMWKVDWNEVILKVFDYLSRQMERCIEERKNYLQSMKDACNRLNKTLYRIQPPR